MKYEINYFDRNKSFGKPSLDTYEQWQLEQVAVLDVLQLQRQETAIECADPDKSATAGYLWWGGAMRILELDNTGPDSTDRKKTDEKWPTGSSGRDIVTCDNYFSLF